MGDRAQILFIDGHTDRIYVYRHWGGNPDDCETELMEFLEWNKDRNDDFTYTVANFLYWIKDHTAEFHTGFGVSNKPFDDVEHTYIMDFSDDAYVNIEIHENDENGELIREVRFDR